MYQRGKKFILMITLMLLGIALSVQLRSNLAVLGTETPTAKKIEDMKTQLESQMDTENSLEASISDAEKKKEEYLKLAVVDKHDAYLNQLMEDRQQAMLEAGLTDVKGPGVEMNLQDALPDSETDPRLLVIHDSYIRDIINELKKAGAQAISVNDERIIATSEQICAGPTIRINKNRYAVPFVIKAIGDPDIMYDSLNQSRIVSLMVDYKIRIYISKSKEVLITKFNGNTDNLVTSLEAMDK